MAGLVDKPMDAHEMLREWAGRSLRARGAFLQGQHAVEGPQDGFDFIVRRPDGTQHCIIQPRLDIPALAKRIEGLKALVITANTRENLKTLIAGWDALVRHRGLTVMFANPRAAGDQRWAVNPAIHDLVTERASLARGLQALFDGVEPWQEQF
jgi:hypothetical protein